ncbi:hypothetical protein CKO51_16105 [Rhodopirellula sp. SM50]|nr:hypothetical protein [Rhodopirellula sp. SM50]PAY18525.1 hypothetical protein CKO51_16105 [Rhodopirellula sp. SM50]
MLRHLFLLTLVILTAGVLTSRRADASCGDWLAHPDDGSMSQQAMSQQSGESVDEPAAPRPCDGPLCRQSPSGPGSPPLPPAPQVQRDHHDAVCPSDHSPQPELFPVRFGRDDSLILPSGHAHPIERPPQA